MPPDLYRILELHLALTNVLQQLKGVVNDNLEGKHNATTISINSYKLNVQSNLV
jgi:hypothetical protein